MSAIYQSGILLLLLLTVACSPIKAEKDEGKMDSSKTQWEPQRAERLSEFSEQAAACRVYTELERSDLLCHFLSTRGAAVIGTWNTQEYVAAVTDYVEVRRKKNAWADLNDYLPLLMLNRVFFDLGDRSQMKDEVRFFGGFIVGRQQVGLEALAYPISSNESGFGISGPMPTGYAGDQYLADDEAEWFSRNFPKRSDWHHVTPLGGDERGQAPD